MKTLSTLALIVFAILALTACGSEDSGGDSCVSLCDDAQAANCSWVSGDCATFCSSVDAVQGPSGCVAQRNAFQSCLGGLVDICIDDCESEENAFSNCFGTYCVQNVTNADCQTLLGAVQ